MTPARALAVLLLMAVVVPAWGQSQIVSTTVLQPTAADSALSDPYVDVNFGASVAVEGSFAAVGIPFVIVDDGYGPGRVGIYTKMSAGWVRTATLLPTNASDIRFGRDVELCGNLAIVAADNGTYVFERSGALWRKMKRIGPPAPRRVVGRIACSGDSFALSIGTLVLLVGYWFVNPAWPYVWDIAHHTMLPVLTLGLVAFGATMLLTRSAMLETLGEDYIMTARAKGLPDWQIRDRHAARNAMLPVTTSLVLALAFVIGGGIVTETIFSWPGMGLIFLQAIAVSDIPLASSTDRPFSETRVRR